VERHKYYNFGVPRPIGYEQLAVGNTPVGLDPPLGATHILLSVQLEPIRWRADADPTSTMGISMLVGDLLDWTTSDLDYQEVLKRIKFIKDTSAGAGDAELQIQYFA
jgi:hypothetical protein